MTRVCGSLAPSTGAPCTQLVGDHEDHCAAGHRCPPAGGNALTALRQVRRGLGSASAGSLEIDELVGAPPEPAAVGPPASDAQAAGDPGADDHEHVYEYRQPRGSMAYLLHSPRYFCRICGKAKPERSLRERWEDSHASTPEAS